MYNYKGNCFISAGMDTSIKIWNLEEIKVKNAIETVRNQIINNSNNNDSNSNSNHTQSFETLIIQFPIFSTTQVHNNYVDSIHWIGIIY
jgi:polycomb protein EED